MKKVEPYTESEIAKGASTYSMAWRPVKIIPSKTVDINPVIACRLWPFIIAWWAQVTVAPELNNIAVLSKGTENGLSIWIPMGGQRAPNSIAGARLLWKKAQKNDTKKHTSETINSSIPIFKPFLTISVWWPWNVASLIISLHQTIKVVPNIKRPRAIIQTKL